MVLPPDHRKKFGSVGLLLSNIEARLVDENEEDVSDGEAGEMWVRGPTVMKASVGSGRNIARGRLLTSVSFFY